MVIPSFSILAVSAITYTVLHETHEQVVFREDSRGSQTTGIVPDISIKTVHVAPDTILSTIPKTTPNVPFITEVAFPLSPVVREFDVSSGTATSLAALWGATSSPSLLRRGQDSSSNIPSAGGTGAIRTASETALSQASSFTSPSSSTSSNTSPSTSSPQRASSNSITETSQPTSSNPVSSSGSPQRPSTSETSDSGVSSTSTTASRTSSGLSETSNMASASSLDSSSPTPLTQTLASGLSSSSSPTNAPESTSIPSHSSSSSSATSASSQATDVSESTSSPASSSWSSASSSSYGASSFSFSSVFSPVSLSTFSTFLTPFSWTFPTSFPSWTSSGSSKTKISSISFSVPTESPSSFSTITTTGTSISFMATGTSFSINTGSSSIVTMETSSFFTTISSSPSSSSASSPTLTSSFTSPSTSSTISSSSGPFPSSSTTFTDSASGSTASSELLTTTSDTDATQSSSSKHHSSIAFMSSTIVNNGGTSNAMQTFSMTIVTSQSGSPATLTSTIVVPSGSLNDGASGNKTPLPKGAIAAIVIVTVLAIAAVALWLFFAYRRRRRRDMHRKLHYSLGGARSSPDRESGLRASGTGLGLGASTVYALGRGVSNSSGMPIRTSPLHGEDADLEAPHSPSTHSGASGDPNSFEGGLMREANVGPSTGFGISPSWLSDPARTYAAGFATETLGGGDSGRDTEGIISDGAGIKGLEQSWLDAAGVGSFVSSLRAPLQPRSSLSFAPVPIVSPRKASFTIAPYTPILRERSVSAQSYSPVRTSLLPTRSEASESRLVPGPSKDSRHITVVRTSSGSAYLSRDPPPSAWSVMDNSRDKGREMEVGLSAMSPANEPGSGAFGRVRSRSSMELSSSGHGNGYGSLAVTSSQGHGSATASGETEVEYSSGSASTGSHQGSATSQRQRKRRSNSEGEGFFARTASLARTNLRSRLRRASMSGVVSDDNSAERLVHPPSPVSLLVTSTSSAPAPTFGAVIPSSPASSLRPSRVSSTLMRSPSPIRLPLLASSAMMRASGPSMRLPAIVATPSPVPTPTPDGAPDGLLDPQLAVRLREIHGRQASLSTLGLRDHEDYSRPIHALVNNRNSSTTVDSDYSQGSEPERTPT